MLKTLILPFVASQTEHFADANKNDYKTNVIVVLLAFLINLVIIGIIGTFLWNNCLKVVFQMKNSITFWQIIGVFILAKLFFCCSS